MRRAEVAAIRAALDAMRAHLGTALGGALARTYEAFAVPGPYSPDAASAGRRALRNRALALLMAADGAAAHRAAETVHKGSAHKPLPKDAGEATLARLDAIRHANGSMNTGAIRGEMQKIIDDLDFAGSFQDFLTFLRSDPQFYYDNPEDLYEAYLATSKRIDPEPQAESVSAVYKFRNAGDKPIQIEKVRTSCGCTTMLKRRAVWNSRSRTLPKEISFSGFSNIGSQTVRMADSNSSTRVSLGTHSDSTCSSATRR